MKKIFGLRDVDAAATTAPRGEARGIEEKGLPTLLGGGILLRCVRSARDEAWRMLCARALDDAQRKDRVWEQLQPEKPLRYQIRGTSEAPLTGALLELAQAAAASGTEYLKRLTGVQYRAVQPSYLSHEGGERGLTHLDFGAEHLGSSAKPWFVLVALNDGAALDVVGVDGSQWRVEIPQYHLLFVRGDVRHGGSSGQALHVRLHVYLVPVMPAGAAAWPWEHAKGTVYSLEKLREWRAKPH